MGPQKYAANWQIDAGVQQQILKGKGTLRFVLTDIFKSMFFDTWQNYSKTYTRIYSRYDTRQVRINFSYRFGNTQVKKERVRKTSSDEERKRSKDLNN